jgi:hypothetical protein
VRQLCLDRVQGVRYVAQRRAAGRVGTQLGENTKDLWLPPEIHAAPYDVLGCPSFGTGRFAGDQALWAATVSFVRTAPSSKVLSADEVNTFVREVPSFAASLHSGEHQPTPDYVDAELSDARQRPVRPIGLAAKA